jgi:hypothetical protein
MVKLASSSRRRWCTNIANSPRGQGKEQECRAAGPTTGGARSNERSSSEQLRDHRGQKPNSWPVYLLNRQALRLRSVFSCDTLVQLRCGTPDNRDNTGDLCGLCQLRSALKRPFLARLSPRRGYQVPSSRPAAQRNRIFASRGVQGAKNRN